MKKMKVLFVLALFLACTAGAGFAIGNKKASASKENAESSAVTLMNMLKEMKPGESKLSIAYQRAHTTKGSVCQLYTRVGGGFIVQTFSFKADDITSEIKTRKYQAACLVM